MHKYCDALPTVLDADLANLSNCLTQEGCHLIWFSWAFQGVKACVHSLTYYI